MFKDSKLRYLFILPVLLLLMAVTVHPVYATEYPGDGIIGADEIVNDDVILDAENPQMLGTVNGMLIIVGNHALVDGTVNGDVIAMGNYVEFGENSHITGNIFSGAYLISMAGQLDGSFAGGSNTLYIKDGAVVDRNLYYGGYSAVIKPDAAINMDAYVGAYQIMMDGSIARDLTAGAGYLGILGSVGRDVKVDVGSPSKSEPSYFMYPMNQQNQALPAEARSMILPQHALGIEIGNAAVIGGELTYTSSDMQSDSIQVSPAGGTVYQTPVPDPENQDNTQRPIVFTHAERGTTAFAAGMVITWVWHVVKAFITLLLVALLIFWLVPQKFDQSLKILKENPGRSFGYGFLAILGGYFLLFFSLIVLVCFTAFLAVITFGTLGFYFFLIGFSCYFLTLALFLLLSLVASKILVAYFVGEWLMGKLSKTPVQGRSMPLIVGLVVYIVLGYIPFLGILLRTIMTLFGTGAIYLAIQEMWRSRKTKALPAE